MRRSLVLTDDSARHSFLASLPPHVRKGEAAQAARPWLRITKEDWTGFLTAYIGCFVAVSIFIA
uniref:hypothetical protein n=1 Tax=Parerythrobacter lutipelagi TaxID=1964208 RepID=UPI0010F63DC6|nr:hypothetical protein [Parerythrobacter lutipelagi]